MKKKSYSYNICTRCQKDKIPNKSPYCIKCSREYHKQYKLMKKLLPNINMDGLGKFINKIIDNHYIIDFNDINTIIFFYQIITKNIYEYDSFPVGEQIKLMWDRILKYYNKRNKEINNI